ncbi:hypothetical protein PACID_15610 [Acidipropionibacterium acidipropionici ATCC 4875]|uniref:Uncharacterized protein n=1 Tax=Acidipropionibacterium acidipropionici (strain ATCC 4875 / DSM 20272 / JCM 6432 / NBRC 12425 / NCIMB 8070 / 4) TaxID=1171373 RepID=K7RN59_ACIA4|nr:hypothetical protein [Acidipropionibacterium acidipropionici]AFV89374.1 hypothetical protein PACID_15610 [Acidipropionibacterium acidipropionici ATCC 4875]
MNHTDTIRELLLEHPFGGPEFDGCECGQIIGGGQDVWADHLAPIIADTVTTKTNKGHEIAGQVGGAGFTSGKPFIDVDVDDDALDLIHIGDRVTVTVLHEGASDE